MQHVNAQADATPSVYQWDSEASEQDAAEAAFVAADFNSRPWTVAASLVCPSCPLPRLLTGPNGFEPANALTTHQSWQYIFRQCQSGRRMHMFQSPWLYWSS